MAGKTTKPPPLPIDVFQRVIRVAVFDGKVLVIIAGTFAVLSAMSRHAPPTVAGVIAAGWGAWEIHSANRLQNGDPRGIDGMILSQIGLMVTVIAYALWMLLHFDPAVFMAQLTPDMVAHLESQMRLAGFREEDLPRMYRGMNTLVYALVVVFTVIFQGLMARFYHRARPAVDHIIYGPTAS